MPTSRLPASGRQGRCGAPSVCLTASGPQTPSSVGGGSGKTGQGIVKRQFEVVPVTALEPNWPLSSVSPSKLPGAVGSRAGGRAPRTGLCKHLSVRAVGRRLERLSGF